MPTLRDSVLRQRVAWVVLGFALVACLAVRLAWAPHRPVLAHDESITFLHAAGKGVEYADTVTTPEPPADAWATAGDWAEFMRADGAGLAGVSASVTKTDRHPPLYFWLLHLWMRVFGSSIWVGRVLQSLIAVLTTLAVYALARATLRDPLVSALSALGFALLPGAIETSIFVRQYELLGLFTVVFVLLVVRYVGEDRSPGWGEAVLLGLVSLLGLLTHLYFAIVVVGGAVWILWRCLRTEWSRVWKAALTVALATGLAWLVAPRALGVSAGGGEETARVFSSTSERLSALARTLANGIGVNQYTATPLRWLDRALGMPTATLYLAAGAVVLAAVAAAAVFAGRRRVQTRVVLERAAAIPFFFVWLTAAVLGLYFAVAALGPAMGPRYLVMTWPLLVLLIALLGMVWVQRPATVIAVFCAWLVLVNVAFLSMDRPIAPAAFALGAKHVVIDDLARGILLPYGEALPASTPVYAAWRHELMADPGSWLPRLEAGDVIVVVGEYQPRVDGVSEQGLLDLVRTRWGLQRVPTGGLRGQAYRLTTRTP